MPKKVEVNKDKKTNNNISNPKEIQETSKSKKQNVLKKKFINMLNLLTDEQYLTDMTYGRLSKNFISAIRVLIAAGKKFFIDDCFTKASSIAYTILVTLIPTLTVALTFYSLFSGVGDKKAELFKDINQFLIDHNLQRLNISPLLDALSGLIENAASIGGIGAIVMIFSATAVLRTLEKSLNSIWMVKRQRPIFIKIIYYWTTLTLGPIMLIAGTTLATQISSIFTSPNYYSATVSSKNVLWVVGTKGDIRYKNIKELNSIKINSFKKVNTEDIDFDNQKSFLYNIAQNNFQSSEIAVTDIELRKNEFNDIQFIDKSGWIVGNNGILLTTKDAGANWNLTKLSFFKFNDIHMFNEKYGYIAADDGFLLKTINGGETWEVITWGGITANLNSFYSDKYNNYITANNGYVFYYNNETNEWQPRLLKAARIKKNYLNLYSINFYNSKYGYITCNNGFMLITSNGGRTWNPHQFKQYNYYSSYIINKNEAYVAGEKGTIIYTNDRGKSWKRNTLPTNNINKLISLNKNIWALGNFGMIMYLNNNNKWTGQKGTNFVVYLLNFFGPFIFIWLLFLLMYIALPNRKIPFKPAAIGASLTGAIWVAFILLFILYVKSFANSTFAVYGALAAIPIFLLIMYASTLIILFGAEVSYTLMHPETYKKMRRRRKQSLGINVYNGLKILFTIYKTFEIGKGETEFKNLSKINSDRIEETNNFIDLFLKENLIIRKEGGGFSPATISKNIIIADIIDLIHDASLELPPATVSDPLRKEIGDIFKELFNSRRKILGKKTLEDIINSSI